jgi:hypothetical protein
MYGADVTVDWEETLYAISTSSTASGVTISAQEAETTGGGSNTITLSGVSSLANIIVKDNGTDVTSSLTGSGTTYTYTLTNVSADHTITLESSTSQGIQSFIKENGNFANVSKTYEKVSGAWVEKTISSVYWKTNGSWNATTSSMSGTTAFKINV